MADQTPTPDELAAAQAQAEADDNAEYEKQVEIQSKIANSIVNETVDAEYEKQVEIQSKIADSIVNETVDPEPAQPDAAVPTVSVQLNPEYQPDDEPLDEATLSVANHEDLVLKAGEPVEVDELYAELLLSSPAVEVAK